MYILNSKTKFQTVVGAILIGFISNTVHASYSQWPLRNKGEVRYLKMIKVYDISLYSPTLVNAENVLDSNISKCLKLEYAVDLSVDKFRLATSEILKRQHSAEYLALIKDPLEALQNSYQAVKVGINTAFCYNGKSKLMRLDLNDKNLIEIKSSELAKAYLGIWLSKNKPISVPLYNSFFSKKKKSE